MNRKIEWKNPVFDEIECVYEKAQNDEQIGRMLEQLEEKALAEARDNCDLLMIGGKRVSPEEFDGFSDFDKEAVIAAVSSAGLNSFNADLAAGTVTVQCSRLFARVMACTIFNILNRLEKTDGGLNLLINKKWTMVFLLPIGGKKGLIQWEMMIMKLYPWISSVNEASTGEVALELNATDARGMQNSGAVQQTEKTQQTVSDKADHMEQTQEPPKPAKKSWFKRLIGK